MDEVYMDEPTVAKLVVPGEKEPSDINFFGATNFRNQNRKFGIKLDDRRRHMYVIGKTGMGKTTMLENMILNDIYSGHGAGYVDPHGDTAEKIINYIPNSRINDVVYFNPSDINYPIGFNILEVTRPEHKHLVASGLMGVFKKIWPDVWSARMEYILNNTILALLDYPGTTLLGINRMLADEDYRNKVVGNSKDPVVRAFWMTEFEGYNDRYKQEAVAPIQNKIGQFLSASVIRNMVAQVKSRIDIRDIMDNRKIFIMNLSKGRIGEDNSRLLGGMLITRIQLAAMERVEIPENDRKDFFLYVDEFQNFATEAFANILSEARKYRLDLTMAHQYMEQLDELVRAAVIGNVGTTITFRVGSTDAEILAKEFIPTFIEEDLVNLPKFQIYLKLMIDGIASKPFSATTLPPINSATDSAEKVIRVSRERYAVSREKIEEKIMRWSGVGPMSDEDDDDLKVEVLPPKLLVPTKESPKPSPSLSKPSPAAPRPPSNRPAPSSSSQPGQKPRPAASGDRKTEHRPANNDHRHEERRKDRPAPHTETVLLGDPNQKGISLEAATHKPSAPATPVTREPESKLSVDFEKPPVKIEPVENKVQTAPPKTIESPKPLPEPVKVVPLPPKKEPEAVKEPIAAIEPMAVAEPKPIETKSVPTPVATPEVKAVEPPPTIKTPPPTPNNANRPLVKPRNVPPGQVVKIE